MVLRHIVLSATTCADGNYCFKPLNRSLEPKQHNIEHCGLMTNVGYNTVNCDFYKY